VYQDELRNYELARSAVEIAKVELQMPGTRAVADENGRCYFVRAAEVEEEELERLQEFRDGIELKGYQFSYEFILSNGLPVNNLKADQWHRLLEVACEMEEGEDRSNLVDAILDWIDKDNGARLGGAEEEYYQELDPPRHCKNGPVSSFEELLLIRDFEPEYLYGDGSARREEEGLLYGGGIMRYLVGDWSPQGIATLAYIRSAKRPIADELDPFDEDEEMEYRRLTSKPTRLFLKATGYRLEVDGSEDDHDSDEDEEDEKKPVSQHRILVLLNMVNGSYKVSRWWDSISEDELRQLLPKEHIQ
jgi:hypothetical protein